MAWRKVENGNLLAPRRGEAPPCPDDYFVLEGSGGFVCVPKIPDCEHRNSEAGKKTACCEMTSVRMTCSVIDKTVYRGDCKDCGARPEWITQQK